MVPTHKNVLYVHYKFQNFDVRKFQKCDRFVIHQFSDLQQNSRQVDFVASFRRLKLNYYKTRLKRQKLKKKI